MCRLFAAIVVLLPLGANAQPPESEQPALSPEEQAEIERALAGDQAERSETTGGAADRSVASRVNAAIQSLNPDIAIITDVALAAFSDDQPLQTGAHDPVANGFNLQQVELSVGSAVDPYFRVDGNIVFSQFGVEIEEMYGTTLALPGGLQARGGQFLTRFGRLNPTHPHGWDFVDQPFQHGRYFGAEGNRGLGLELSWLTPLPWYVQVIGSAQNADGECCARSFYGAQNLGIDTPLDFMSMLSVVQFFELGPNWSLLWHISGLSGPNPTGRRNRSAIYGTSLYIKYRPITYGSYTTVALQAEWMLRRRQVPEDALTDYGGYAYLTWRFAKNWDTGLRFELGSPAKNGDGATRMDLLDPEWVDYRYRYTAQLTYRPTEFSRFRAQLSLDDPRWLADPIAAAFLAYEFSIGAHPAHPF